MSDCSFQYSAAIKINCRTVGDKQPAFVLLHGFGTSIETWYDIQPLLSDHAAIYMLDLKGFGLSSKPKDDAYSPENQADIAASFIKHHNLRDFILVGHSYGGGIALLTYKKLKELGVPMPRGLVLIDAAVYQQQLPFFVSALRRPLLNRVTLKITSASFRARHTLKRVFRNQAAVTEDRVDRYARFFNLPGAHDSFITAARQIDDTDPTTVASIVRTINIPTLIIWGSDDPVISLSNAYRLKGEIAGSKLEVVQDCGHVPHEEFPRMTAEAILGFYGGL